MNRKRVKARVASTVTKRPLTVGVSERYSRALRRFLGMSAFQVVLILSKGSLVTT